MHLMAVNDKVFSMQTLRDALLAGETTKDPLHFTVKRDDNVKIISIDYHGGLRYPTMVRVDGTPDRLDDILAPLP
jgi:hypothetical protein